MRFSSACALAFALAACGGAETKTETAKNPDEGLGEYVASKGPLPSLGGAEATPVVADGLRLELLEKERPVSFDGLLDEWPARAEAKEHVKGSSSATMAMALQYDDSSIYVGAEIHDDKYVRTSKLGESEDHASLVLSFPTASGAPAAYEIALYAGKPGELTGLVRYASGPHRGQAVPKSKIVEAPIKGGYSFEAQLPWSALPEASRVRVGIRGVARYYDGDGSSVSGIVATGPGDASSPGDLPPLPTESELTLAEQLLVPQKLTGKAPKFDRYADVGGDGMRERVAVFDHYLVVLGSHFLGGTKFFFRDLGGEAVSLELRDVTGRGKADILVRRRFATARGARGDDQGGTTHDVLEVLSSLGDGEPQVTFAHEVEIASGKSRVVNSVHLASKSIDVTAEPAVGWDASSFQEPLASDLEPLLLPWGAVKSQTFKFDGKAFVRKGQVAQATHDAPAAREPGGPPSVHPAEPPTPPVKKGGDLSAQVLEQYKKDRGVSGAPKVDLQVNAHGDAKAERVILIGKDIVVFGPGFKGGTGYAFITLAQFADASDIQSLSARDLTGDGAADLVVRGTIHRSVSGSSDTVDMDVLFVYEVKDDAITRVFAIETGREQAGKRVQGLVQFIPSSSGRSFDVDVQPGRATGWTEKSYPWSQEQPGSGALEPLLLPWGGITRLRYSWNGAQFAKQ